MKKLSLLVVAALSATFILDSCSVQKRYHRTGFNVNWNHTSVRMKKDKHPSQSEEIVSEEVALEEKVSVKEVTAPVSNYTYVNEEATASVNDEVVENVVKDEAKTSVESHAVSRTSANISSLVVDVKTQAKKIKNGNNSVIKNSTKASTKHSSKNGGDVPFILLIILCFIIPPIAVGLATDWDLTPVLWNIVWTVLCGVPGIIHALIHVIRNK